MKVRYITNWIYQNLKFKRSIWNNIFTKDMTFLNAETISGLLGISSTTVYEMMHQKDFPVLRVGNRMVVPKEKFKEWVDKNSGGNPWNITTTIREMQ